MGAILDRAAPQRSPARAPSAAMAVEGGERKIKTFLRCRPINNGHPGYAFPSVTQVTVPVPHGGASEVTFAETEESSKEEMKQLADWYNSFDIESCLEDPK